jgi:hypothetical protein
MTNFEHKLASLTSMPPAQLRAMWRDVWSRPAPDIGPDLLRRGIAWKLQARVHGDIPAHARREVSAVATRLRRGDPVAQPRPSLRPGSRLVRDWQGRTHQVVVLEHGYEYESRHFRSLTQIARAITGTHQSGLLFFGIRRRQPLKRPTAL